MNDDEPRNSPPRREPQIEILPPEPRRDDAAGWRGLGSGFGSGFGANFGDGVRVERVFIQRVGPLRLLAWTILAVVVAGLLIFLFAGALAILTLVAAASIAVAWVSRWFRGR